MMQFDLKAQPIFRSILISFMDYSQNSRYNAQIKEEYLPPPLEKNYLSLLDVHVKATKQTLTGTEDQKMAIIKKRIKKFFDYGSESSQNSSSQSHHEGRHYLPPSQINMKDIKKNMKIICNQIILYGKAASSFEIAEKMLPGFVGYEKIDNCNVKLSFQNEKVCKSLLSDKVLNKGALTTQNINNPFEIGKFRHKSEWFEIIYEDDDPYAVDSSPESFYARFATNKDEILVSNDNYFRKLLGKARDQIQKRQQEEKEREKYMQEKAEKKKAWKKRKFIAKFFPHSKKYHDRNDDSITNYDGVYGGNPSFSLDDSTESYEYNPKKQKKSYGRKYHAPSNKYFDSLNISSIRETPIEFEESNVYKSPLNHQRYRSFSRDELQFEATSKPKTKNEGFYNSRESLIKAYRQKQAIVQEQRKSKLDSYDFDQDFRRQVQKEAARGKKALIQID